MTWNTVLNIDQPTNSHGNLQSQYDFGQLFHFMGREWMSKQKKQTNKINTLNAQSPHTLHHLIITRCFFIF